MDVYGRRISKLFELSENTGKSLLLTDNKNIYYYTGLWDSNGYLCISGQRAVLLVDFRYGEIAQKTVSSAETEVYEKLYESLDRLIKSDELLVETNKMTVQDFKTFSEKLKTEVSDSDELSQAVEHQRMIKDSTEIQLLQTAQQIAEQALLDVLPMLKPGVTERSIANELEHRMKCLGAECASFDLITITGKKTSLPHGVPSDDIVRDGDFFTFDIGAVYKGYHSDMTRTYAVGHSTEEMKKIYDIVLTAHTRAMQAVQPGVSCSEIDRIARDYIYENGYEGCFGHSTGHGVGLDIHEKPCASHRDSTVLQEGMVITVEPGIYIPDRFGVRIEDTVAVTKNGCRSFATIPKEFITL